VAPQKFAGRNQRQTSVARPAVEAPSGGAAAATKTVMSVQNAMKRALDHYNAGRLQQAGNLCRQLVQARPRHAEAHNLLAVILKAQGNDAGAVKTLQRAIHLDPNNALFHSNLGEIERQRGKTFEAGVALNRALELDPNSPQALNNLGILHFDKRDFEEAVKFYQQALEKNGSYPEAHNNLGNALRSLGRADEALEHYQRALLVRENYPEAYNNLASILGDRDQVAEAEHAYRKAISIRPNYVEAYGNLAKLLVQHDREDEALRTLGEALKINPKDPKILVQVARTQLAKGNVAQAEQAAHLALKEDPQSAEGQVVLGQILLDTDQFPQALKAFERALELKPDLAEANNMYGVCLKTVGRLDDARKAFEKALEFNPRAYGTYASLAELEKFTPNHPHLKTMETIIGEAEDPRSERYMGLHFALGKAYDDLGEYKKAINHFNTGATLKRAKLNYNETEAAQFFDSIKSVFTKEIFENRPFKGSPTSAPEFIIGMPRSGSTLVEQVLSSHPDVFGAGEIKEFSRQLGALRGRFPALPKFPTIATKMNHAQYQIVADGYLSTTTRISGNAARVTDKLLSNYYFAGMLHLMFPNARFIHTKRHPVDTCLSAYTKLFKDDMPHSYDFGELGRYYRRYEDLMNHWDEVLPPGTIKTVIYEDVVGDLEKMAREIVAFVGLPWNDACLSFHESTRPVKTASVVQIRKQVYSSSVERWRRYGDDLKPLFEALGLEMPSA
jgi:tetratricopeptide (TPR) repeat protein